MAWNRPGGVRSPPCGPRLTMSAHRLVSGRDTPGRTLPDPLDRYISRSHAGQPVCRNVSSSTSTTATVMRSRRLPRAATAITAAVRRRASCGTRGLELRLCMADLRTACRCCTRGHYTTDTHRRGVFCRPRLAIRTTAREPTRQDRSSYRTCHHLWTVPTPSQTAMRAPRMG